MSSSVNDWRQTYFFPNWQQPSFGSHWAHGIGGSQLLNMSRDEQLLCHYIFLAVAEFGWRGSYTINRILDFFLFEWEHLLRCEFKSRIWWCNMKIMKILYVRAFESTSVCLDCIIIYSFTEGGSFVLLSDKLCQGQVKGC